MTSWYLDTYTDGLLVFVDEQVGAVPLLDAYGYSASVTNPLLLTQVCCYGKRKEVALVSSSANVSCCFESLQLSINLRRQYPLNHRCNHH